MVLLEINNLRKSFQAPDGSIRTVIDVAEFRIDASAQVAVSGESGSGKTTLLNLIAGILKPDSGRILLAGREMSALRETDRDRLRATTLGYIFQSFNLLQGYSCLENVLLGMAFGPGVDLGYARELLERVGLKDHLRHRPRELSTGQQQRVAVAPCPRQSTQTRPCRRTNRKSGPHQCPSIARPDPNRLSGDSRGPADRQS
jgi:ABC-type lipoprotein export system ATPase subunit